MLCHIAMLHCSSVKVVTAIVLQLHFFCQTDEFPKACQSADKAGLRNVITAEVNKAIEKVLHGVEKNKSENISCSFSPTRGVHMRL